MSEVWPFYTALKAVPSMQKDAMDCYLLQWIATILTSWGLTPVNLASILHNSLENQSPQARRTHASKSHVSVNFEARKVQLALPNCRGGREYHSQEDAGHPDILRGASHTEVIARNEACEGRRR
jgi:hypothetical protein